MVTTTTSVTLRATSDYDEAREREGDFMHLDRYMDWQLSDQVMMAVLVITATVYRLIRL